jgi:hypothetical protein
MATVITRTQYLEINSTPLATPAWRITDLSRLYGLETRGSDRILPGADGMLPYRRRVTSKIVGLPLLVSGAQDHEAGANSDIYEGLDDNIDYLIEHVATPGASPYAAVWHRANGAVEADVQIEGFSPEAWGRGWVRFTLEISIPAGIFTPVTP